MDPCCSRKKTSAEKVCYMYVQDSNQVQYCELYEEIGFEG
jgi:hypothetical protein